MSPRRDLFDFLASRGASKACPVCGREDWDGWDQRAALPRTLDGQDYTAVEVVPLLCRNCGFMRLHSAHVLSDPRDENTGG